MINEKDYWIGVRDNAVKAVCNLLAHGGNYRYSLSDAIGRDTLTTDDDWLDLLDDVRARHIRRRDYEHLLAWFADWRQACNEINLRRDDVRKE